MIDNLKLDFGSLNIQHICYIFHEPEMQARIMESLFNMPKFIFSEDLDHPAVYRGRETKFSIKMGQSRCFDTTIEIYQWLKGDCIYKEFIDTKGEGLHHFGFFVDDLEKYINNFEKKGIDVIQKGLFPPSLKYAYMNTVKTFGVVIEFVEIMKRQKRTKNGK
jgi:methylmalonyl-CoA/ethylmalonyl-CoA epimerase